MTSIKKGHPVHYRHIHIRHNDIYCFHCQQLQRFNAIRSLASYMKAKASPIHLELESLSNFRLIIHDQYSVHADAPPVQVI
ncbi:hypothetical protein D3C78_1015640 [compost metagenome]